MSAASEMADAKPRTGEHEMTAAQVKKLVDSANLQSNASQINVYKHHTDGTVSRVHSTFRVDSIAKFLKRKTGKFSVSQA